MCNEFARVRAISRTLVCATANQLRLVRVKVFPAPSPADASRFAAGDAMVRSAVFN